VIVAKAKKGGLKQAQSDGVALVGDVELAAGLPATARSIDPNISINLVNLIRDPGLADALWRHADLIDAEGAGTVDEMMSRIPVFVERFDAYQRLCVSTGRVRDALVRDNVDFGRFATAIASIFNNAGKLSAIKKDAALKKLAGNRSIQRGLPKMVKTRKKKLRAKKRAAAAKGS
jgi:hypothetical protein